MKGKDKKTLHTKTIAELTSLLQQKREELAKKKMEMRMSKVKNVHTGTMLRREIAIMETIKKEKEIANG